MILGTIQLVLRGPKDCWWGDRGFEILICRKGLEEFFVIPSHTHNIQLRVYTVPGKDRVCIRPEADEEANWCSIDGGPVLVYCEIVRLLQPYWVKHPAVYVGVQY